MTYPTKILIAVGLCLLMTSCTEVPPTDTPTTSIETPAVAVSIDDFNPLLGDGWEGALTYLNYGSDKRSTIPVRLIVNPADEQSVSFALLYPGEEDANADGVFSVSEDGSAVNGEAVISRRLLAGGGYEIITQSRGQDDNRPADIQIIYSVSERLFKMRKMVRFDGAEDWIERNEYILKR